MNFFKTCFSANTHPDFDEETVSKVRSPHQKLKRDKKA